MQTGPLIERLAQDLKPVRRRALWREALALLALATVEFGLFAALGMMRPDLSRAMHLGAFWWKLASAGIIALLAGSIALLSLDPVQSPRRGLWCIAPLVAVSLGAGWLLDASEGGLLHLLARLDWPHGVQCFATIGVLSIPAVVALGILIRRGAPTDPAGTALAAGIAAAGWGAFVFAFACPSDDPFFAAFWYVLSGATVTLFARYLLASVARW